MVKKDKIQGWQIGCLIILLLLAIESSGRVAVNSEIKEYSRELNLRITSLEEASINRKWLKAPTLNIKSVKRPQK